MFCLGYAQYENNDAETIESLTAQTQAKQLAGVLKYLGWIRLLIDRSIAIVQSSVCPLEISQNRRFHEFGASKHFSVQPKDHLI